MSNGYVNGKPDLDLCASCFKPYTDFTYRETDHLPCHFYVCGHGSCGYDVNKVYVNKCLFPKCIEKGQETRDDYFNRLACESKK